MSIGLDQKIMPFLEYSNIQEYKISDTDCENLALKAKLYGFDTIIVMPSALPIMEELLDDTNVKVAVAVAYPSGAYVLEAKMKEIEDIFETGYRFDELYVTLAVGRFLSGYEAEAVEEIKAFVEAARGKTVKLVVEASVMTKEQKKFICDTAEQAGIEYIVASTGFAPYDVPFPTEEDIKELAEAADGRVKIVACGGIDTKDKAIGMIEAGAAKICTTEAFKIAKAV